MRIHFNCRSHKIKVRPASFNVSLKNTTTTHTRRGRRVLAQSKGCRHVCVCMPMFQKALHYWWKGLLTSPGETCLPAVSAAVYMDHCHLNEKQQQSNRKCNYILPFREIELIRLAREHQMESKRLFKIWWWRSLLMHSDSRMNWERRNMASA